MKMKRMISILVVMAMILLSACAMNPASQIAGNSQQCNHDYYLSGHTDATTANNGSNTYTCKKCGASYTEVIPKLAATEAPKSDSTKQDQGYSKDSKTINLFDLPLYSGNTHAEYETSEMDYEGYKHSGCYTLEPSNWDLGDAYKKYIRYELNGNYTTLKGKIYITEGQGTTCWIDFYDGDDFLYSTARIGGESPSTEFEFDISGVNYLTVYPRWSIISSFTKIIADPITLTK